MNPSSIPAGQSTNVAFTVDIASGMSSDRLQLYVAKANPGGAPVKMGYFEAERLGRSEYTFALSINEPQPTVLHLQVYLSKQTIAPSTTPISNCDLQVRAGSDDGTKVETGIKIAKFFVDKFKDHKGKHPPDSQDNKPPTLTAGSITLQYPRDWTYHQEVVDSGGPINLRNFENHLSGGVVPSGGAEIDVTDVKSNGETLNSVVLAELGPTRTEDLFVDGHPALRAFYTDLFASDLIYENQAVYVMDGNTIHKFFLSYRSGDSNQDSFVQAFQAIISSAHFAAQ